MWVLGDVNTSKGEQRVVGLGKQIAKKLTEELKHKYHHDYFDELFHKLQTLEKVGIYGCVTERRNWKQFPPTLKTMV